MNKNEITVHQASEVLRNELMRHGDLYDGFLASIKSAIRDMGSEMYSGELAELILKRIIGERESDNE